MEAMREKDEADFDLERFTEMFDTAMTSNDPRVKNALRQLMMMVILTDSGDHEAGTRARPGPLRRMQEEMHDMRRWVKRLDDTVSMMQHQINRLQNTDGETKWPRPSDIMRAQVAESVSGEDAYKAKAEMVKNQLRKLTV